MLKDVVANIGELVMASGSIGDMNGPFVFIGDTSVAGGYKPISKIYQGANQPTISTALHGSTLDGVPYHSTNSKTLFLLNRNGNVNPDLTGNIENRTVSGLTINNLTGFTGKFNYYVSASQLNVEYDSVFNGNVLVNGTTSFKNGLNITGDTIQTGSLLITSGLTVSGETLLKSNLYISGNLQVLGSSSVVNIESNVINFGDNIIKLNSYAPFDRYSGIEVYDSGSSNLSGSVLWDSVNDYWFFQSSTGLTSKLVGTTYGSLGNEVSLSSTYFPIATSNNTIGNSLLYYTGTTFSFNDNFKINSSNGSINIYGNVYINHSGSTDNGIKTSGILFKNSDNIVGFVSTTETSDVLDSVLGYKTSNGNLVFSNLIDAGTY